MNVVLKKAHLLPIFTCPKAALHPDRDLFFEFNK